MACKNWIEGEQTTRTASRRIPAVTATVAGVSIMAADSNRVACWFCLTGVPALLAGNYVSIGVFSGASFTPLATLSRDNPSVWLSRSEFGEMLLGELFAAENADGQSVGGGQVLVVR